MLIDDVTEAVCTHFKLPLSLVLSDKRSSELVTARTVMAMVTKRMSRFGMTALGRKISRDPTSLSKLAEKGSKKESLLALTDELLGSITS